MRIRPSVLDDSELVDADGVVGREPRGVDGVAELVRVAAGLGARRVEIEVWGFGLWLLHDPSVVAAGDDNGIELVGVTW